MQDAPIEYSAAEAQSDEAWMLRIDEIGEELGYFQPIGGRHAAFFVDESPTLLVTFETVDGIRAGSDDQMPYGYRITRPHGWSHLCLIADGETWYRDPAVYAYFDRLVDDAFFEDFDRVVFYGAGMCGYAAAAYSVAAPGATVIALRPLATLDPRVTGWDARHATQRRRDFNDRYGYAPDMIDGADKVYIAFDPERALDAMHAALFTKPFVEKLRCPNQGARLERELESLGVLPQMLERACDGSFDTGVFARSYRARRDSLAYLLRLIGRLEARNRFDLVARACRWGLERHNAPRLRRALDRARAELAQAAPEGGGGLAEQTRPMARAGE
jgi:hypothetical protein